MKQAVAMETEQVYSRMRLIPSWNYEKCASADLAFVGMSGLGAPILQQLTLLGIGEKGITTLIDPDIVEPANRSRIPFATPEDDGKPKVELAKEYVERIRPARKVRTLAGSVTEEQVQMALGESEIIIGAVDSELARFILNYYAHSFCVPYFDSGSGIFVDRDQGAIVHGGGQVRVVIPGTTPCLLCNMGINRSEVDRELMKLFLEKDPAEADLQRDSGYIRGIGGNAEQPSVANLNFFVATSLVSVLLGYLLNGLDDYHAIHFDLEELSFMKSSATRRQYCPVCGDSAEILGNGKPIQLQDLTPVLSIMPDCESQ